MDKKVLIVEDEPDISDAIAETLRDAGMAVTTASNGKIGLEKALTDHPDLILLDLKMPVMDGHEVLKHLRQDSWGSSARIIVLTSMDDVRNVAGAHSGDIEDYIIKAHTSLEDIIKKVRMVLFS